MGQVLILPRHGAYALRQWQEMQLTPPGERGWKEYIPYGITVYHIERIVD
jgi:hypothetical protein